jgi:hypothetical protein
LRANPSGVLAWSFDCAVGVKVRPDFGVIHFPNARLVRIDQVRKHGSGIQRSWHASMNVDTGKFPNQLEDVQDVNHRSDFAARVGDHGPRNDAWNPHPGLIGQ